MKSLVGNGKKAKKSEEDYEDYETSEYLPVKSAKKKRSCLLCGTFFNSTGPFNRRCPRCSRLVSLGKGGDFSDTLTYRIANGKSSSFSMFSEASYYKSKS